MQRRTLLAGLPGLFALSVSGCASKPTLHVHHAQIRSASFQGVGLDLYVAVHNDNSYDIQIRNVRARVVIANRYPLPPLTFSPQQWLPSGEKTLVRVPMVIPYPMIPAILQETILSPVIPYSVQGSADVTAIRLLGIEKDNYPLNERGSVLRQELVIAAGMSL